MSKRKTPYSKLVSIGDKWAKIRFVQVLYDDRYFVFTIGKNDVLKLSASFFHNHYTPYGTNPNHYYDPRKVVHVYRGLCDAAGYNVYTITEEKIHEFLKHCYEMDKILDREDDNDLAKINAKIRAAENKKDKRTTKKAA